MKFLPLIAIGALLSLFSVATHAQPFYFQQLYNGSFVVNLDQKPFMPAVADAKTGTEFTLGTALKGLAAKPTLIVIGMEGADNYPPMNSLIGKAKASYNTVFIEVNQYPLDSTREIYNSIQQNSMRQYADAGVTYHTPHYTLHALPHEIFNHYGIDGSGFIVLDKDQNIIQILGADNTNEEYILTLLKYTATHTFTKNKWYYNQHRVATVKEANEVITHVQTAPNVFQVTSKTLPTQKVLWQFSYRKEVPNSMIKNYSPDGNFVFYADTLKTISSKGDVGNGLINNVTVYNREGAVEIKATNMQAYNKNMLADVAEMQDNVVYKSTPYAYVKPVAGEPIATVERMDNGKKKIYQFTALGKLISYQVFNNGKLDVDENFDYAKSYYQSGQLARVEEHNAAGRPHGQTISYFKDGSIEKQTTYVNGLKHGKAYKYFENGKLAQEITYENNNELTSTEYYTTGSKKRVKTADGTSYYYRNGQLFWKSNYGRINSVDILYYSNGNKIAEVYHDDNGKLIVNKSEFYNRDGSPASRPYKFRDKFEEVCDNIFMPLYMDDGSMSTSRLNNNLVPPAESVDAIFKSNLREMFMVHFGY